MERTGQPRTFTLTERTPAVCRLAPADVDFLLTEHRGHVELAPTGRRGQCRLTPTGHVGTIVGPTCRLVIRPKIPVANLFYLLDPTGPVPAVEDQTTPQSGTESLDFLAGRLARLLAERAAAGLHRAYAERAEQGPYLQGRLDLPAHLRDPGGRKDRLHCRYEDLTIDVPCNQLPKATAELVLRSPLLGEGARAALRRALPALDGVSPIAIEPASFAAALTDRLTDAYRPLLDLCRLLVASLGPGPTSGATPCPAFLLAMEEVFEQYLVSHCRQQALERGGRYTLDVQRAFDVTAGEPALTVRPDLVVNRAGCPVAVVDAKWKKPPVLAPDVYQVLAYCTTLGVERGLLVYPGRRDRRREYRLARSPVVVTIRTLRVVGAQHQCRRSAVRLGRSVTRATP